MARRRLQRRPLLESEAVRIEMLGLFGGFHHKAIARRIFGTGKNYIPSNAEVARVGRILRDAGIRVREWRDGTTQEAQEMMKSLDARADHSRRQTIKLRVAS